jgi:hypothetical protein
MTLSTALEHGARVLYACIVFALGLLVGRLTKRPRIVERRVIPIAIGKSTFRVPDGGTFTIEAYGSGGGGGGAGGGRASGPSRSGGNDSPLQHLVNEGYGPHWSGAWTDDAGRRWWRCSKHLGDFRQHEPCPDCTKEERK